MGAWSMSRTTSQVWPASVLRRMKVGLTTGVPPASGLAIAYRTPGAISICSGATSGNEELGAQVAPPSVLFQNPKELPPWSTEGSAGSVSSSQSTTGGPPSRVQVSPPSLLLRSGSLPEPTAA
jgi:hypothetical protein